jgi:molybdopterin-guanine dinucleotide biosynthesis protein A
MMASESVAGLVLSGGRGSRHAGADKGWLQYQRRPLIEHALQHLQVCEQVIISANRNQARYAALGAQVVSDRRAGYQGALSGIESAFIASDADWLYVVPVDVLGMPGDWLEQLQRAVRQTGLPWCGTRDGDRLQPLLGLWSRELLGLLSAYLDSGERRVMRFVEPWSDGALALPGDRHLLNLNTPKALAHQER